MKYDLEGLLVRAARAGMNAQLREGVAYAFGVGRERYLERHATDPFGPVVHAQAADAWGYVEGGAVVRRYEARSW